MLSLRWYDAQGCIESEPFNFLENLPLFITMIIIFQRYTPYLWGITQQDSSKVDINGHTFHIDEVPSRFQLHGRRTTSFNAETLDPQGTNMAEDVQGAYRNRTERRGEDEISVANTGHVGKSDKF